MKANFRFTPSSKSDVNLRVGAFCHVYYPDLMPELLSYLENIPGRVDLLVSTDTASKQQVIHKILSGWTKGHVEVQIAINRGRDIAPRLTLYRHWHVQYDIVLYIHTKSANGVVNGEQWRNYLLKNLAGSADLVDHILKSFYEDPELGIMFPEHWPPIRRFITWGGNFARAKNLAHRFGLQALSDSEIDFPSGSMFWARPSALKPLLDLEFTSDDFDPEAGQTDGTLAHAIERLFLISCECAGYKWHRLTNRQSSLSELGILSDLELKSPTSYAECVTGPRVYCVSHRSDHGIPATLILTPMLVGAASVDAPTGTITDRLMNGDALLNVRWCELSAIYKIWREGPKSDTVGFCHYRRFLVFGKKHYFESPWVIAPDESAKALTEIYGGSVLTDTDSATLYVAQPFQLGGTVFETYARWHSGSDYLDIFKIVNLRFPKIGTMMARHFNQHEMYAYNLFTLNWVHFDELCLVLFSVLSEFLNIVDWPRGNTYQNRDVGFLAERIFDAWVRTKAQEGVPVVERPLLCLK